MAYQYYISPEEYQVAKNNGISKKTLENRVRDMAWDMKRAITTPIRQRRDLAPFFALAESNGISAKVFHGRMRRGWEPERACTQPISKAGGKLNEHWESKRIYPLESVAMAEKNGVSYKAFQWRMKHGWSLEDATATKKLTTKESSSRAYAKSNWKTGVSLFKGREKDGVKQ